MIDSQIDAFERSSDAFPKRYSPCLARLTATFVPFGLLRNPIDARASLEKMA
jgi:hypothetical protein